jgi:Malate/L-lactate dehydrogenases
VFIPGEMVYNRSFDAEKHGVEINDSVIENLRELSKEYTVAFPLKNYNYS